MNARLARQIALLVEADKFAQHHDHQAPIEASMPDVWPHLLDVIESFCAAGVLRPD